MHISATPRRHHICFQLSQQSRFACRIGGQGLSHEPLLGSLAICPAGIDYPADAAGTLDAVLVAIDPRKLALAAAEDAAIEPQLVERLSGHDEALLDLGRKLAGENAGSYPTGALFWNEVAGAFIDGLITRHTLAR
jgi:AraC family transcriptional regulator